MGNELYRGWLGDEAAGVVLQSFGADNLDGPDQETLAELVGVNQEHSIPERRRKALCKILASNTNKPPQTIEALVQTLQAGIRDRSRPALTR